MVRGLRGSLNHDIDRHKRTKQRLELSPEQNIRVRSKIQAVSNLLLRSLSRPSASLCSHDLI